MANNEKTQTAVRSALGAYEAVVGRYGEDEDQIRLVDLLSDLRHLADREELDFAQALDDSATHHKYEVQNPEEAAA